MKMPTVDHKTSKEGEQTGAKKSGPSASGCEPKERAVRMGDPMDTVKGDPPHGEHADNAIQPLPSQGGGADSHPPHGQHTLDYSVDDIQPLPSSAQYQQPSVPGAYAVTGPPQFHTPEDSHGVDISGREAVESNREMISSIAEDGLVSAIPVSDDMEEAQPMESNPVNHRQKKSTWVSSIGILCMGGFMVLFFCGILVLKVAEQNGSQTKSSEETNTTTASFRNRLEGALSNYNTIELDPTSPQSQAYQWIKGDPWVETHTTERLVQRYAMAVFYYSTNGDDWTHRGGGTTPLFNLNRTAAAEVDYFASSGAIKPPPADTRSRQLHHVGESQSVTSERWMTYETHECDWVSMAVLDGMEACNDEGQLEWLSLRNNGLVGTLPPEIGLLSNLKGLQIWKNSMQDFIPTEIGLLRHLNSWI